jgi:hypothetical protein
MFGSNKYRSKRVKHLGYTFASQFECAVFNFLLLREKAQEIRDIQCQDHIYLTKARIPYIPDFKFLDLKSGEFVWAEAKGFETDPWKIKRKLWQYYGPGKLEIYKGSAKSFKLYETVIPE